MKNDRHEQAGAAYRAQGIVLRLMADEMDGSIEHRAMARVLFRLDERMAQLCPALSPTPKDPEWYINGLLNEWYKYQEWLVKETV